MNTRPNLQAPAVGEASSNFWAGIAEAGRTFLITAGTTYFVYEVSNNILGIVASVIKAIFF